MFEVKLSGFADEISTDLQEQISAFRKMGISYIEMRGVNGKSFVEYSLSQAEQIKRQLEEAGMRLSAVGSPIGKIEITDDFEPHFELFRHTVDLAHLMETPYIRMFSFYMPQGKAPENWRDEVFRRLEKMADYASRNNVILLHENEKEIYGDIAPRCLEIMERFAGPNFRAVFDFANFVQCGQDTWEAWNLLKPYVEYVHVKDAISATDEVVPAGKGEGQVEKILRQLKEEGYHGFLSLEPHLFEFEGFTSLELASGKSVIRRKLPPEEAFRTAKDALQEILDRIS